MAFQPVGTVLGNIDSVGSHVSPSGRLPPCHLRQRDGIQSSKMSADELHRRAVPTADLWGQVHSHSPSNPHYRGYLREADDSVQLSAAKKSSKVISKLRPSRS